GGAGRQRRGGARGGVEAGLRRRRRRAQRPAAEGERDRPGRREAGRGPAQGGVVVHHRAQRHVRPVGHRVVGGVMHRGGQRQRALVDEERLGVVGAGGEGVVVAVAGQGGAEAVGGGAGRQRRGGARGGVEAGLRRGRRRAQGAAAEGEGDRPG